MFMNTTFMNRMNATLMTRQPQRAPVTKPVLEVPLFTVVPDRS
jgi:hypothetical protein